jgi:hypothetical protein
MRLVCICLVGLGCIDSIFAFFGDFKVFLALIDAAG